MLHRIVRLAMIVIPLVAVLLIPEAASAAPSGSTTTVSIGSGTLEVGGADISLTYSCFPNGYGPYNAFGDVRVAQANGVTGDTFFHPLCIDKKHSQTVFVPGNFTAGGAAVNAFICGFDCGSDSKEIKLH
jgi:hypothetical protein